MRDSPANMSSAYRRFSSCWITGMTLLARLRFLDEKLGPDGKNAVLAKLPPEANARTIAVPAGAVPLTVYCL